MSCDDIFYMWLYQAAHPDRGHIMGTGICITQQELQQEFLDPLQWILQGHKRSGEAHHPTPKAIIEMILLVTTGFLTPEHVCLTIKIMNPYVT